MNTQVNTAEVSAACRAKASSAYRKNKAIPYNIHLGNAINAAAAQHKISPNDIWAANNFFYKQMTIKSAEARSAKAAKAPKVETPKDEVKTFVDLYRSWVVNNDIAPSDYSVCHFADVCSATLSNARMVLKAEGYDFESQGRNKPWKVTKRPEVKQVEAPAIKPVVVFTDLEKALKSGDKEMAVKLFMGMLN